MHVVPIDPLPQWVWLVFVMNASIKNNSELRVRECCCLEHYFSNIFFINCAEHEVSAPSSHWPVALPTCTTACLIWHTFFDPHVMNEKRDKVYSEVYATSCNDFLLFS